MTKRDAVIFDRDGTLFSVDGPTDQNNETWRNFNARIRFDPPVPAVHTLWHLLPPSIDKIMVSGRDGEFRLSMRDSNTKHNILPDAFFMRPPGDRRKDSIVKEEILDKFILPRWNVLLVVDDRPPVCDMWRSRGLHVLQVVNPKITPPIGKEVIDLRDMNYPKF